jgi:recombination protein RecA
MPDASLDTVLTRVNKALGTGTLIRGSDLKNHQIPRVTSGSIAIDLALGGGWPLNCWSELLGEPSHGKTVIALKTIAAAQESYRRIHKRFHTLWIAAEPFVSAWAEQCNVNLDDVIVADTRVMEDAYQIVCEMLDSRLVDAVVIDSLSSLTPTEEDDKAMDEWQMGLGARLTGKFMRKSSVAQRRSLTEPDRPCLGIIISQWREKIGVMYGDNRVSPNGRAKEFFFMVRVEVRRDEWLGTDKHRVGQTFKARVIKNKTAPPQRGALVDFYWEDYGTHKAGTYDTGKQLANIGMDVGVVELHGSYYKFGGKQWQGKEKFWAAVDADELLQHQLAREIRMIALPGIAIDIPAAPKQAKRALKRA